MMKEAVVTLPDYCNADTMLVIEESIPAYPVTVCAKSKAFPFI